MLLPTNAKGRHPRHAHDQYDTPPEFAAAALSLVTGTPRFILDPGAGIGTFGIEARKRWPRAFIVGVEVQEKLTKPFAYDDWVTADFGQWCRNGEARPGIDLICGNPPYSEAESWIRMCLPMLSFGGQLVFLLRSAFRHSKGRASGLFREHPPLFISDCDVRPRFYGEGNGATDFSYFVWSNSHHGLTYQRWSIIGDDHAKKRAYPGRAEVQPVDHLVHCSEPEWEESDTCER